MAATFLRRFAGRMPILLILGLAARVAAALPQSAGQPTDTPTTEVLLQRISDWAQAADDFKTRSAASVGPQAERLAERALQYRLLGVATERLITVRQKAERLQKELSAVQKSPQLPASDAQSATRTFALSEYDAALGELETQIQRRENIGLEIEIARSGLENASEKLNKASRELRLIKDARTADAETSDESTLWTQESLKLEVERLETEVRTRRQQVANLDLETQLSDTLISQAKDRRDAVRQRVRFDEADLDRQLDQIEQHKIDIDRGHPEVLAALKQADLAWQEARTDVDGALNESGRIEAEADLRYRDVSRKALQVRLEYMEKSVDLLDRQQQIWRQRYALLAAAPATATLKTWRAQARGQLVSLRRLTTIEQRYQVELQQQISAVVSRLQEENLLAGVRRALASQRDTLSALAGERNAFNTALLTSLVLENRLLDELASLADQVPLKERIVSLSGTWRVLWNFEVWQIDGRPVTIGKLIFALLIFIIGMVLAKFFLGMFQRRFLNRAQLKDTTAATIHKVISYITYLLVLLLALRIVNIPLAAFAFLGGAVAIGVGFGAQNLINNFISGFIIMGEQPINIGDLIEVDGIVGQVEEIGARCTRVRTGENIHILVPNSSFLEKNIINWTLADHKIRAKVVVGVAYGSPTDQVEKLLLEAVEKEDRVLQTPAPFVLFTDFGDNSLAFEVHFWITVQRVIERRTIESSVRFAVDARFRQADITIAFPQRDVHLDTLGPIEVQLRNPSESA